MSTRSLPRLGALAVAATTALALAACSGGEEPGATESTKVQVLTFASQEQFQPLIDAFAKVKPDITIEVQTVPFNDLNSVIQSRVGGKDKEVDVYMVDQPRLASLASKEMLVDLTGKVTIPDGAVLPDAVEASTFDGKLYAMPVQTSTQLLFYNKDLAAAGDLAPTTSPDDRLTWEQVVAAGTAAKGAGAVWGLLFEQGATPYQVLPLVQSLGGGSGLTGDDNLTPDLLTPEWEKGMQWWSQVHADEVVPRGMGFGVTTETFAKGDAAFLLAGPWNIGILGGQDLDFEWGITAHPFFEGGKAVTPTGSMAWGINPGSDAVDAAAELLEFVGTTKEGSLAVAQGDPNLPTQAEALDAYLAGDSFGDGVGDLIRYELENTAVSRPVTTGYIAYETILGKMMEDVRNGTAPGEALAAAQTALAEQLAK